MANILSVEQIRKYVSEPRLLTMLANNPTEFMEFDSDLQLLINEQPDDVKTEFMGIESKALPINNTRSAKAFSVLSNNGLDPYSAYSMYLATNSVALNEILDSNTVKIIRLACKALVLQLRRQKKLCEHLGITDKKLFNVDYDAKRGIVTRDIDEIYKYISDQIKNNNKFYLPTENQGTPHGLWLPKDKLAYYTLSHFCTLKELEYKDYDKALKFLLLDMDELNDKRK